MSVDLTTPGDDILLYLSQYANDYANARQIITQAVLGLQVNVPTWLNVDVPDTQSRQFQLIYTSSDGTTNYLVFDIALGYDGLPQRITYTERARQNIEQSSVGFHVEEFGMAPGSLDFDCIIVYQGYAYAQVQAFFNFIQQSKSSTNPLLVTQPGSLVWLDLYLQRSLTLSLQSMTLDAVAGTNNMAHLTLQAAILQDYSNPQSQGGQPVKPIPNSQQSANQLVADVLEFVGLTFP